MVALAEKEAELISQRTNAALARAKVNGTKSGIPLGAAGKANLMREGTLKGTAAGVVAVRRAKAEAYAELGRMIAAAAKDGLSLSAIAKRLNANGELTRRGRPWTAIQVSRVFADAGSQ